MNSIKNTFVAVLLLGASYGVYQAITTPDTTIPESQAMFDMAQVGPNSSSPGTFPELPPPANAETAPPRSSAFSPPATSASNAPATRSIPRNDNRSFSPSPEFHNKGTLSKDDSVRNAFGNSESKRAEPIGVLTGDPSNARPHDHALISALKKVTGESDESAAIPANSIETAPPVIDDFEFMKKSQNLMAQDLAGLWPQVESMVDGGDFRNALVILSRYYYSGNINGLEKQRLMVWLNHLCGKVIYSDEHHFQGRSYTVRVNDSLDRLASQWGVPADLILGINRKVIADPENLTPGTELKIVLGPFNAELDRSGKTLTLFVKRMFAGQFDVANVRNGLAEGIFRVESTTASHSGFGQTSSVLKLSNGLTIGSGADSDIQLSAEDMDGVCKILNPQSHIRVRN